MQALEVKLDGDGAWPELAANPERIVHLGDGNVIEIAALAGGMRSGRTSLALHFDLPDGRAVIAEVSLRLFLNAAVILQTAFPEG